MKRIYHTWEKWECYPAGFYESRPKEEKTQEQCEQEYKELLEDIPLFEAALQSVLIEWPKSCEHYLSNDRMNRIAWLGQASLCYARGIPSCFRGGFNHLSEEQQLAANLSALKFLNRWLEKKGEPSVTLEQAGINAKADLY
jgi:hypothetical protein